MAAASASIAIHRVSWRAVMAGSLVGAAPASIVAMQTTVRRLRFPLQAYFVLSK